MRTCPNCGKVYANDLFFCLDDGTRLRDGTGSADPDAPTEVNYGVGTSLPTEVIRAPETINISPAPTDVRPVVVVERSASKLPYVAIGLLVIACLGLASTLIVLNLDRIFPSNKNTTNSTLQLTNTGTIPTPAPATPSATLSPVPSPSIATKTSDRTIASLDPSGKWSGSWSTQSGTLFDFDLTLSRQVMALDGSIRWTMRRTARTDKSDKIGQSATEYVRGNFDPTTGTVNLTGYSKDDPNSVLVMLDVYKLQISTDGKKLTGTARNGGKWNGKIDLSR
jgi:hypothetical protein